MTYMIEDFMTSVVVSDVPFSGSPCWLWTGRIDDDGYGWLPGRWGARDLAGPLAHRFSLTALGGKRLIDGLVVDHLCRTRNCVNPAHLEQVDTRENTVRGHESRGTARAVGGECKEGHPLSGANLKVRKSDGYPLCRTCEREYQRAYAARKRYLKRSSLH